MKHNIIAISLIVLTLNACNLENVKDSKVKRLAEEKNVKALIDDYIKKPPSFGTDQAAEALGNLGDKQAIEPLIAVLNNPVNRYSSSSSADVKTHAAAAIALGKLKDIRAVKPLMSNVNHSNTTIATAAKTGLKDIASSNPKILDELLLAFKKNDANAVAALGAIGKPALEPMLVALKDTYFLLQYSAKH